MQSMALIVICTTLSVLLTGCKSLKEYKFSLTSTSSLADANQENNKLYLSGNSLVVLCSIYDPDNIISTASLMSGYAALEISPSIEIYNRTWSSTYRFPHAQVSQAWRLTINRLDITSAFNLWPPSEQWKIKVTLTDEPYIFKTYSTLLDISREPWLQWSFGSEQSNLPSTTITKLRIESSPCSGDVAIISPTLSNGDVYLGVTYKGFEAGQITWYSLGSSCNDIDCEITDFVVTNYHVVILNTNGVHVSNDLKIPVGSSRQTASFTRSYSLSASCDSLMEGKFSQTKHCQFRHQELFRDDMLILMYKCSNGHTEQLYSVGDFSEWSKIYDTAPTDLNTFLAAAYNYHTNALNVLYLNSGGGYTLETRLFLATSSGLLVDEKRLFPAFTFAASESLNNIFYHPMSHILYAYGDQGVWTSYDGGNHFEKTHNPRTSTPITGHAVGYFDGVVIFTVSQTEYLYGKTGISRLATLAPAGLPSETGAVFVDHMGDVSYVSVSSGANTVTKTVLDMQALLESWTFSFAHPLALFFTSTTTLYLYEHHPLADSSATTGFSDYHIGQVISFSSGGTGVIQDIEPQNVIVSGYLNQLRVSVIDSIHFETYATSPAQKHTIEVQNFNAATGLADLVLTGSVSGGDGWQSADVTKSVVIAFRVTFLVTSVADDTNAVGKAIIIPTEVLGSVPAGQWYIFNGGVDGSDAEWSLGEDICRYKMEAHTSVEFHTAFELDVRDKLDLSALAIRVDDGKVPLIRRQLQSSVSNPWVFRVKNDFSHHHSLSESYENLTVSLQNTRFHKGVAVVRVEMPFSSLLCRQTSALITYYAGCPCRKRLVFRYTNELTKEQFLHESTEVNGAQILHEIEPNYRPPSQLGIGIPLSKHVYNADPSAAIPRNTFKKSQESLRYNVCANKTSRADCGCTDDYKYSADAALSDCRERVYGIVHPGKEALNLTIVQPGKDDCPLTENHLIFIREINDREPDFIDIDGARSILLEKMRENDQFKNIGGNIYRNPLGFNIHMNGSELYHYRVELMPGLSNCHLYSEFQFYVSVTPIAYPLQYVLNFAVAFVIGGLFFIIYFYYLKKFHKNRVRQIGPVCPDIHAITEQMSHYPPQVLHQKRTEIIKSRGRLNRSGVDVATGEDY